MTAKERIQLYRQLATLIDAGIVMTQALETITRQSRGGARRAAQRLKDHIERGSDFADGAGQCPTLFPPLHLGMLRAGEHSGRLDQGMSAERRRRTPANAELELDFLVVGDGVGDGVGVLRFHI